MTVTVNFALLVPNSYRQPGNRALAYVVAAGEFGKRCTLGPSLPGLDLLRVGEFRGPAHALPALLGPAAALGGAGADKVTLHIGETAKDGDHQPPGAGASVGPRLRQRAEFAPWCPRSA